MLAGLFVLARGNYHYETFKVFNFAGESEPYHKPWFFDDYSSPYKSSSNVGGEGSNEGYAYETVAEQKSSPEVYENPAEAYFLAKTKKEPREDKSFKKSISPFYTLTDSDDEKYKAIVLKSGVPYCQETKSKPAKQKKRYRRDAMTCYKCKDPKNGATYEQCSYSSEPQETVRVDEYVPLPAIFRYRRSSTPTTKGDLQDEKPGYRFGEEFFEPAVSADEAKNEHVKKVDNCKKVVKDSMVCMVCKDPETNGKYEQCSYSNQPKDKAYGYSESSSFGIPDKEKETDEKESRKPVESSKSPENLEKYFEEQTEAIKRHTPKVKRFEESAESARLESGSEHAKDGSCKKVLKDSMVCTVCKDPKTGGSYEQCSYAHHPNDKVYQFSRQKSFGYPNGEGGENPAKDSGVKKSEDYSGYRYEPEESRGKEEYDSAKYYEEPTERQESQPYEIQDGDVKSESERISDEVKGGKDCEKIEKDGMTCSVCKDPKTGGNFEQCSYAYQPNDKVFSFSRAKSFGSPEFEGDKGSAESPSEYGEQGSYGVASDAKPQVAEGLEAPGKSAVDFFTTAEKKKEIEKVVSEFEREDRSKCKKVIRDKLTCFQCKDKDGVQKEECIFVAAQEPPKDRIAYREVKEFQGSKDSETPTTGAAKQKRKARKIRPSEPALSASETRERRSQPAEESEDESQTQIRENQDAVDEDPYDFAAETKPTYDKVLGITLPRYMLTTSEHEAEFDEVVASDRI